MQCMNENVLNIDKMNIFWLILFQSIQKWFVSIRIGNTFPEMKRLNRGLNVLCISIRELSAQKSVAILKHEMFSPFVEIDSCTNLLHKFIAQINTKSRYQKKHNFIEEKRNRLRNIMLNELSHKPKKRRKNQNVQKLGVELLTSANGVNVSSKFRIVSWEILMFSTRMYNFSLLNL